MKNIKIYNILSVLHTTCFKIVMLRHKVFPLICPTRAAAITSHVTANSLFVEKLNSIHLRNGIFLSRSYSLRFRRSARSLFLEKFTFNVKQTYRSTCLDHIRAGFSDSLWAAAYDNSAELASALPGFR